MGEQIELGEKTRELAKGEIGIWGGRETGRMGRPVVKLLDCSRSSIGLSFWVLIRTLKGPGVGGNQLSDWELRRNLAFSSRKAVQLTLQSASTFAVAVDFRPRSTQTSGQAHPELRIRESIMGWREGKCRSKHIRTQSAASASDAFFSSKLSGCCTWFLTLHVERLAQRHNLQ